MRGKIKGAGKSNDNADTYHSVTTLANAECQCSRVNFRCGCGRSKNLFRSCDENGGDRRMRAECASGREKHFSVAD